MNVHIEQVIFDLGGVLVDWNPQKIADNFSEDKAFQQSLLQQVFGHSDWLDLDRGVLCEQEAIERMAFRCSVDDAVIADLFYVTKESLVAIDETVSLLRELAQSGKKVYCLSNMAIETYGHIREKYDFFELFEGIVVSGYEKIIKPDADIFNRIVGRYDLNPAKTLFVDDMSVNVESAKASGMNAIRFRPVEDCYASIRELAGL